MSRDYCDYLIDQLAAWGTVTARRMFGGYGIYRGRLMFGLVDNDTHYFKVGETNRNDYEEAGSHPFTYEAKGKQIALSYWLVPTHVLDDETALAQWAEKSYGLAVISAAKKVEKAK